MRSRGSVLSHANNLKDTFRSSLSVITNVWDNNNENVWPASKENGVNLLPLVYSHGSSQAKSRYGKTGIYNVKGELLVIKQLTVGLWNGIL